MALTALEIIQVMEKAKELGVSTLKVEGVEIALGQVNTGNIPTAKPSQPIPEELKPEDIMAPMSVFDELDEEELLYWSTPYYDEIQAKKQAMREAKENGTNEISDT